jgi:hypothetical protein
LAFSPKQYGAAAIAFNSVTFHRSSRVRLFADNVTIVDIHIWAPGDASGDKSTRALDRGLPQKGWSSRDNIYRLRIDGSVRVNI